MMMRWMKWRIACVYVLGEYGECWSGHQRVAVFYPGYQSSLAGRETRGFWQSPGRDGGWTIRHFSEFSKEEYILKVCCDIPINRNLKL